MKIATRLAIAILGMVSLMSFGAPTKCAELEVPGYTLDATLPDFPLLVRISESRIGGFAYADCQTGGTDISFRLPDGTLLDHEVDTWNPDGESLVWVRIPSFAKGTTFTLYYGDSAATEYRACQNDGSVWRPAGYVGVWHMSEASGAVHNSAGYDLPATPMPAGTAATPAVAGKLGGAREVNAEGEAGYFLTPSVAEYGLGSVFVCSAWVNVLSVTVDNPIFSAKDSDSAHSSTGWFVNLRSDTEIRGFGSSNTSVNGTVAKMSTAGWTHHYYQYDGATFRLYYNAGANGAGQLAKVVQNDYGLAMGNRTDGNSAKSRAQIDEVRLRAGGNGGNFYNWDNAEFNSVWQSDFVTAPNGAGAIPGDTLTVVSSDGILHGTPAPAYGVNSGVADGEKTCTTTPRIENADASQVIACTGWTAYGPDGVAFADGTGTTATFTKSGAAMLEWHYDVSNRLDLVTRNCTLNRATSYLLQGETVTLVATPNEDGAEFIGWDGDLPEGANPTDLEQTVTMDRPRSLRAVFAGNIHVSPAGDDEEADGSAEAPYATLQKAVDAAAEGDIVWVDEGSYTFADDVTNIVLTLTKNVKVRATGERSKTIIDAARYKTNGAFNEDVVRKGLYMTASGAELCGFTITNCCTTKSKTAIPVQVKAGLVTNSFFHAQKVWCAASLDLSGTARLVDIDFAPGVWTSTYDAYYLVKLYGDAVLENARITGQTYNKSYASPIIYLYGNGIMRNCLVAGNKVDISAHATNGEFIRLEGKARMESCTVADNTTQGGRGLVYFNSSTAMVTNSVIWGNVCGAGCMTEIYGTSGSGYGLDRIFASCSRELEDGVRGNIAADPQFEGNGNYAPKVTSPCVDAAGEAVGTLDALMKARVVGAAMDLGGVECPTDKSNVPLSATISVNTTKGFAPLAVTFTAALAGSTDGVTYAWTFSDGTTSTEGPVVTHAFTTPGACSAALAVGNAKGETAADEIDGIIAVPEVCYVSKTGGNRSPFVSWDDAAASIEDALDLGCREVVVGPGTYTMRAHEYVIGTPTWVHSSEGPEVTELTANTQFASRRIFSVVNGDAVVSGFTFTGGAASDYGYVSCLAVAAGVVSNCVVKDIKSTSRSSVNDISGTGRIVDCVFDGHGLGNNNPDGPTALLRLLDSGVAERCTVFAFKGAGNGGGHYHAGVILDGANAVLRNSLVYACSNTWKSVDSKGNPNPKYSGAGVVVKTAGGLVENCTIANNRSGYCGAGLCFGAQGTVRNTIAWGNEAERGFEQDVFTNGVNKAVTEMCTYSCAPELTAGEGNITEAPRFATSSRKPVYSLSSGSPCVNAALGQDWMAESVDLSGAQRLFGVKPDMGCYEKQKPGLSLEVR